MNNLRFRRQFLLSPASCDLLDGWNIEYIDKHFLYLHPDLQFEKSSGHFDLYLIGFFLNPHTPKKTSKNILDDIAGLKSVDDFPKALYSLVGRFVLIVKTENDFVFFHDACGLRMLFYAKENNAIYAASQPLLLGQVLNLNKKKIYYEYFNSEYVKTNKEYALPSGLTLYDNVFHLAPNHYLDASLFEQIRYYPFKELDFTAYPKGLKLFTKLLKKTILAANHQMNLTFTLTAGWDSRIILSCCKDIIKYVPFHVMKYWKMTDKHKDIKIAKSLAKSLQLNFEVYDCQRGISSDFAEIYQSNSDLAHAKWEEIAYGMSQTYPHDKVAVKGNCSEIGRCFYYPSAKQKTNLKPDDFLCAEPGWEKINFIRDHISNWLSDLKKHHYNYNLQDLFYWEHRMGSWQAQSQLEWDIVQEVFSPFNCRELLDVMLSIDSTKRKNTDPELYKDAITQLWKDTLKRPVNPLPLKEKIPLYKNKYRRLMVNFTKTIGLYATLKKLT